MKQPILTDTMNQLIITLTEQLKAKTNQVLT